MEVFRAWNVERGLGMGSRGRCGVVWVERMGLGIGDCGDWGEDSEF